MKTSVTIIAAICMLLCSCKKEYACKCSSPGGTETVFVTTTTKTKAKKQCDDYYQSHFGSVPFNETDCGIK